jgi:riboflavin kinase/FMN adenylyltransferase
VIRAAVEEGALGLAARLLGRDFGVFGTVMEGRKLGRTLGFPTANVRPESEQLPPNGVYAVRVAVDGKQHAGIANVGVRPTISSEGAHRLVEVHLFDFSGDLYGSDLEVFFLRFIRAEQKFPNLDALRAQIAGDVAGVRASLAC